MAFPQRLSDLDTVSRSCLGVDWPTLQSMPLHRNSSLFPSFQLRRFGLTSRLGLFGGARRIWWIAGTALRIVE